MRRFLIVLLALAAAGSIYAAPVTKLELLETGGTATTGNLAASSTGAVPFSSSDFGNIHTINKLNDGLYGNGSTWIGGSEGSFAGVRLPQAAEMGGLAFGRDNTGAFGDRCIGTYSFQYTETSGADANTPDDQWTELVTIDYALSPTPTPARRHLFRFPPATATALRVITVRDIVTGPHALGIDELEVYAADDPILDKPALPWKQWVSPLVKQGYLNSPLVEVTPISFKGKLYLLESWHKWSWPGEPSSTAGTNYEMWMAELSSGAAKYDERNYLSLIMSPYWRGSAIVWDDRVYVFGVTRAGTSVFMSESTDMTNWSTPVKVFDSPAANIFNVAITRDRQGLVFMWETDAYGSIAFTMCYGRVNHPTESWQPGIIEGARYGMDKYTGGPAIYYAEGWYYTLYLERPANSVRAWETRITRSRDLKHWEDAPSGRPFVTFDFTKQNLPLDTPAVREVNASDAELCYHDGQTIVFFTGGDQDNGGDLQWATYAGTSAQLFAEFFPNPGTLMIVR